MLNTSRTVNSSFLFSVFLAMIGLLFLSSCTNAGFEVVNDDIGAVRVSLSNDEKDALCRGKKRRKHVKEKTNVERKVEESVPQDGSEDSPKESPDADEGRN